MFNGDILLAGHVPNNALLKEINKKLSDLSGYRRLFIQLNIRRDADINPKQFKVMTTDQVVYLMGDVLSVQAKKVIMISRKTTAVKRVVTLLRYYHVSDK